MIITQKLLKITMKPVQIYIVIRFILYFCFLTIIVSSFNNIGRVWPKANRLKNLLTTWTIVQLYNVFAAGKLNMQRNLQ